jgi:hypothetical protein
MKCILHIGTEKTGTTLIQNWLYQNAQILSGCGIYLSRQLGGPNNLLLPQYFTSNINNAWARANKITSIEEKRTFFKFFSKELSSEIERAEKTHEWFLITAEHFHSQLKSCKEIEGLYAFLKERFSEVQVCCYFRNQSDLVVSLYSTALRGAYAGSLDDFIDGANPGKYYFNYFEVADNWSNVFGRENCKFSIYDRSRFLGGDIRLDFFRNIDLEVKLEDFDFGGASANESLFRLQAIAFRMINQKLPLFRSNNNGVCHANKKLKRAILQIPSLAVGRLFTTRRREIEELFSESNEFFFNKYFGVDNQFISGGAVGGEEVELRCCVKSCEPIVAELLGSMLDVFESKFNPEDADVLRDASLKLARAGSNNLQDSLKLMRLARNLRPEGPLINNKIEEWERILRDV